MIQLSRHSRIPSNGASEKIGASGNLISVVMCLKSLDMLCPALSLPSCIICDTSPFRRCFPLDFFDFLVRAPSSSLDLLCRLSLMAGQREDASLPGKRIQTERHCELGPASFTGASPEEQQQLQIDRLSDFLQTHRSQRQQNSGDMQRTDSSLRQQ